MWYPASYTSGKKQVVPPVSALSANPERAEGLTPVRVMTALHAIAQRRAS